MSSCDRPIDPIDAEALSAGAEPVFDPQAAEHARRCPSCAALVEQAGYLSRSLSSAAGLEAPADLPDRILRLRSFSLRERRSFAIWRGACGLCVAVFFAGLLLLTLPGITVREQAGVGLAAVAPLLLLLRAFARAVGETLAATPSGLQALSQALRQQQTLGLAALALLVPILFGLRRAASRIRR